MKKILLIMFSLFSFAAFADDCWNARQISQAAHDLDNQAQHFHQFIHNRVGYSHLATDAHRLAESADHLHRIADSRVSCEHIQNDFWSVQSAFDHLSDALQRAHDSHHDRHVMRDFRRVANAYYRVEHLIDDGHGDDWDNDHR